MIVLATGSGKTMIITVRAVLTDARTTILVVSLVALQNDLLWRFCEAGIQSLIQTIKTRRSAFFVLVLIKAACSEKFLEYVQYLAMCQQLNQVVIDKCQLTIIASDYRDSMVQLG